MDFFINRDTQLCVSLSARPGNFGTRFQNFLYRRLNLNWIYKAFPTEDIAGAIAGIRALGIRGSAISMPFNEACIPHLSALDPSAEKVGSVNTIVNEGKGFLRGYNTDYSAVRFLAREKKISKSLKPLIAGSGGMAKAVAWALKDEGFSEGFILSRNERTGKTLADKVGWSWVKEFPKGGAGFLVNATPVGMAGGAEADHLSFSESELASAEWVFDAVAIPAETPMIRAARKLQKNVLTGNDVIVPQAIEQFILYTGIRPDESLAREAAEFATGTALYTP